MLRDMLGFNPVFHLRIVRMAIGSLRANFLRSLLATLGVIIGVSAVISAVSILEGLQRDVLKQFESLGADQVFVMNGTADRSRRRTAVAPSLTLDDADFIRRKLADQVRGVAPNASRLSQVKRVSRVLSLNVLGTSADFAEMNSYHAVDGRFLNRQDDEGEGAFVCALGHKAKEDLFGALPAVGNQVRVDTRNYTVVGVMEERGILGLFEVDNMVFVPIAALQRATGMRFLETLSVRASDTRHVQSCIDAVTRALRESHGLRAGQPSDFQIFTQEQVKSSFGDVARLFAIVLYSIAGISLVVGGIGIMNIMMVSVTERTREIGVRIAVGARPFDIGFQFLIEAGVISLLGGALGVLVGFAFTDLLSQITQVLHTYTPPSSIVWALVMATFVGVVSGLYPAIRAANLDPVDALRFE